MNILVIGASGFIGRNICEKIGIDNNIIAISRSSKIIKGAATVINCDLLQKESAIKKIKNSIQQEELFIINLASELASNETKNNIDVLINNIKITETVAEIVKNIGAKRLINISSMAVYPNIDGIFSEESATWMASNEDCLYGLSKFCSENILSFFLRDEDVSVAHLRVAQVYGYGMRQDRIMPMMKKELAETRKITIFGNGDRVSCFISIEKLCEKVAFMLANKEVGIFNVGEQNMSFLEVANLVLNQSFTSTDDIVIKNGNYNPKFFLDYSKYDLLVGDPK